MQVPTPKENKKEQNLDLKKFLEDYLIPTVSLIIMVLIIALVTIPTINKISENRLEIENRKAELVKLQDFANKLTEMSSLESTYVANDLVIDKYLPKESRVAVLIDDIEKMADGAGLTNAGLEGSEIITEEEPTSEEGVASENLEKDKPKRVLVTFNYAGTFDEVYRLFEEINKYKGLLTVQTVLFEKGESSDWDVEITVASYNLPADVVDIAISDALLNRSVGLLPIINEEIMTLIKERVGQ